jgi:glucosamine 6-phosphate synthetase-like amidotransferase/phosphosugar isomerase protein
MNAISAYSYLNNPDGDGAILWTSRTADPLTIKSNAKLHYEGKVCAISTHQRLTTSGEGDNNLHPHERPSFLLQHNGIFSGMGNENKSDTNIFCDMLQEKIDGGLSELEAIKTLMPTMQGSYSIVYYSKAKKQIWYFRNDATAFYMLSTKSYIIGSTSRNNVIVAAHLLHEDSIGIFTPATGHIYHIGNKVKVVGQFEPYKIIYPEYCDTKWLSVNGYYGQFYDYSENSTLKEWTK